MTPMQGSTGSAGIPSVRPLAVVLPLFLLFAAGPVTARDAGPSPEIPPASGTSASAPSSTLPAAPSTAASAVQPEAGGGGSAAASGSSHDSPSAAAAPLDDELLVAPAVGGADDPSPASADSAAQPSSPGPGDREPELRTAQINVFGGRAEDIEVVPGSAHVIGKQDMKFIQPLSAAEALRTAPGINVVEESDGVNLRPNIGFRGLDPDRSRTLLLLEDGVPVAMAPYGEPEAYYSPPMERIERIEIVKGSGSILHGPQTIGGVINYITPDPAEKMTVLADVSYGSLDYLLARAGISNTHGQVGYYLSVMHKRLGGHRQLNLSMWDVFGKLRLRLTERSWVGMKLQVYDETSNATYIGLNQGQYETDPSFNFASHDIFLVRRFAASAQHNWLIGAHALLQTSVYGHNLNRDWSRQDYERFRTEGRTYERIINGDGMTVPLESAPNDGSAVYFRNTQGNRQRNFSVGGLESRLTLNHSAGVLDNELTGGLRFHTEFSRIRYIEGEKPGARTGNIVDEDWRHGHALAAFALNRFTLWKKLHLSPGFRFEGLLQRREILREKGQGKIPEVDSSVWTIGLIPGLGVAYEALPQWVWFAGVHRGFAPPRTKDAISSNGQAIELSPEYSWNTELGTRYALEDFLTAEVTGFHIFFTNQIIEPTESSGGVAEGGMPQNSGETTHLGVETALTFDPMRLARAGFNLPLLVNYTFVEASFGDGWAARVTGNRLPYAPQHMLTGQLRFEHPWGYSAQVAGNYVSEQFGDKENTAFPSVNGVNGPIPARFLLDARAAYTLADPRLTIFLMGKNLTGARYIASRRPAGIQPGPFRHIIFGIQGEF
ncbi:MAG: Vitamin B12 transporter BtuB [Myxococcota bacterium]|nr:Vitamin B12 transporter BtuB [Myxococcota bacterium]